MRVVAVLTAGVLTVACSESASGVRSSGDATPGSPAARSSPQDIPDVGTDGSPTPTEALLVTSGPGLSRPLPLDRVDHLFLNVSVDRSYHEAFGDLELSPLRARLKRALAIELRENGLHDPTMPSNAAECFGCEAKGHVNVRVEAQGREGYAILLTVRVDGQAKRWSVRRKLLDLNLVLPVDYGTPAVQLIEISIQNDIGRLGTALCSEIIQTSCRGGQ